MSNLNEHDKEEEHINKDIIAAIKKLPTLEEKLQMIALHQNINRKKELAKQCNHEIEQIHRSFEKHFAPLDKTKSEIICGERKLTQQEIETVKSKGYLKDAEMLKIDTANDGKAIENFWYTVLKNSDTINYEIKDYDHDLLKFVTRIECIKETNSDDFSIVFHFAPNDFIENEVLTKKFFIQENGEPLKSVSTLVRWKPHKDLTKQLKKQKSKSKKKGGKKTETTNLVDVESFFNFFKSVDEIKEPDKDNEDDVELMERMDIDIDIGRFLEEEAIPFALEYFLGVKQLDEEGEGEEEEPDEEDEEEEAAIAAEDEKKRLKNQKKKEKRKKNKELQKEEAAAALQQANQQSQNSNTQSTQNQQLPNVASAVNPNPNQKPECKQQ